MADPASVGGAYRPTACLLRDGEPVAPASPREVAGLDDAGFGGFLLPVRDCFPSGRDAGARIRAVRDCLGEARRRGLRAWLYDDLRRTGRDGLPAAQGRRRLRVRKFVPDLEDPRGRGVISCFEHYCFSHTEDPTSADVLDRAAVDRLLRGTYDPCLERLGGGIEGLLTDRLWTDRDGIPWHPGLPAAWEGAFGEPLSDSLLGLFAARGDYRTIRLRFWRLVSELFDEHCVGRMRVFCRSRGLRWAGRMAGGDVALSCLTGDGVCLGARLPRGIEGADGGRIVIRRLPADEPIPEGTRAANDALARAERLLSLGHAEADAILLCPRSVSWIGPGSSGNGASDGYRAAFQETADRLETAQAAFLVCGEAEARAGRAEDGALRIGGLRCRTVIAPPEDTFGEPVAGLLSAFRRGGGRLLTLGGDGLPEGDPVADGPSILYARLVLPGEGVRTRLLLNRTDRRREVAVRCEGEAVDPETGRRLRFPGVYVFPPLGCLAITETGSGADARS